MNGPPSLSVPSSGPLRFKIWNREKRKDGAEQIINMNEIKDVQCGQIWNGMEHVDGCYVDLNDGRRLWIADRGAFYKIQHARGKLPSDTPPAPAVPDFKP